VGLFLVESRVHQRDDDERFCRVQRGAGLQPDRRVGVCIIIRHGCFRE
jgi:hypothetical protein